MHRIRGMCRFLARGVLSSLLAKFGYELYRPEAAQLVPTTGWAVVPKSHMDKLEGLGELGRLRLLSLVHAIHNLLGPGFKSDSEELDDLIHSPNRKSQLGLDVLVAALFGKSHKGFFVEFGATDGKSISNTFLLEEERGWTGILCEPGRIWHPDLKDNRSCVLDFRCVYSTSELSLTFVETATAEYSTIKGYEANDLQSGKRNEATPYYVESVSLIDLLRQHNAPNFIELLSVDTEGSEFDILSAFDFKSYEFGVIAVEHNYSASREKTHALLLANGYKRVLQDYSLWDDWYFSAKHFEVLAN
jgi:hypothetical protein